MIFEKNFDRSLWLLIIANKRYKNIILDFIKSIPSQFIDQIRDAILNYKMLDYNQIVSQNSLNLYNGITINKNELYSFSINKLGLLKLTKALIAGDFYESILEISLFDISSLDNFDYFDGEFIGDISYKCNDNNWCESEYILIKMPLGYLIVGNHDNSSLFKYSGKFINLWNIPNNLNIDDVTNFNKAKIFYKEDNKKRLI